MFNITCHLCNESIVCKGGDMDILKKHIKIGHNVVKYKVGVILALCFTTSEELGHLVDAIEVRLESFKAVGRMEVKASVFQQVSANKRDTPDTANDDDPKLNMSGADMIQQSKVKTENISTEEDETEREDDDDDEIEVLFHKTTEEIPSKTTFEDLIKLEIQKGKSKGRANCRHCARVL